MKIVFRDASGRTAAFQTFYDCYTSISPGGKKTFHDFRSGKAAREALLHEAGALVAKGFRLVEPKTDRALLAIDRGGTAPKEPLTRSRWKRRRALRVDGARHRPFPPEARKRALAKLAILGARKPRLVRVSGPADYLAFLRTHGCVRVGEVWLFDPKEREKVFRNLVQVPRVVELDGGPISTAQLVPFAREGAEVVWCFCPVGGRWPVYRHHQDQPAAIYVETGEWIRPRLRRADFSSFSDWITGILARA